MTKLFTASLSCTIGLALCAVTAHAQYQVPAPIDFTQVEMTTTKMADNFYTVQGNGSTMQPTETGVLTGPDGILIIDDEYAPLSAKLIAAIKAISTEPIRFVVNTHLHADHTGGNATFGKLGATIIARGEVRTRLAHPNPQANGAPGVPAPPEALPLITYEGRIRFHMDGEDVELIPLPPAHTDGDTLVYLHNADILMTGDFYRSIQYPNIDRANGGTLQGLLDALGVLINTAGPNTRIVPGHGPVVGRAEVIAHRDIIVKIKERVAQLMAEGKTQDEIVAAHPTADFDAKVPKAEARRDFFVMQVYSELKAAK